MQVGHAVMKEIVYEVFFNHTDGNGFVDMISRILAGKARLRSRRGKEPVDVSFIDSTIFLPLVHGKIFFINGELTVRNPQFMDYSVLLTRSSSPRHYRTCRTLFVLDKEEVVAKRERYKGRSKTKFCNFIYSHVVPHRNRFARQLMKRKKVDCAGYCLNNTEPAKGTPASTPEKIEFISRYKFTICFEHTPCPGYITEKIYDALRAGSVPIYLGASDIALDINPQAFIDVNSFPNYQAAIDYIVELDQNAQVYESYLQAEPFTPDSFIIHDTETNLEQFYIQAICEIIDSNPIAPSFSTRLYRYAYCAVSLLHIVATHHHVDGLPLRRLLLDWRSWLRAPLTIAEKLRHYRKKRRHYAMIKSA